MELPGSEDSLTSLSPLEPLELTPLHPLEEDSGPDLSPTPSTIKTKQSFNQEPFMTSKSTPVSSTLQELSLPTSTMTASTTLEDTTTKLETDTGTDSDQDVTESSTISFSGTETSMLLDNSITVVESLELVELLTGAHLPAHQLGMLFKLDSLESPQLEVPDHLLWNLSEDLSTSEETSQLLTLQETSEPRELPVFTDGMELIGTTSLQDVNLLVMSPNSRLLSSQPLLKCQTQPSEFPQLSLL